MAKEATYEEIGALCRFATSILFEDTRMTPSLKERLAGYDLEKDSKIICMIHDNYVEELVRKVIDKAE